MIVVTGASKGLGRAVCERFVAKGKSVLGMSRTRIEASFPTVSCDVTDYKSLRVLCNELRKQGEPVEALINAAGIASMNLAVTTPEHITRQIIETNLIGTIFTCQLFAPLMIRRRSGRIINFSTIAVKLGLKGESIYIASKAGVEGFSRAFAREVADFGITVNCISPGPVNTDLLKGVNKEQLQKIIEQQILTRQFEPDAVCDIVETLISEKTWAITGEVIHVGGA